MSGYRVQVGWGNLCDSKTPDTLPIGNQSDLTTVFSKLNNRFGAGAEISISVNRNPNYLHDLGIRGISVATPGAVECDFTINCTMVPAYAQKWMKYAFAGSVAEISPESTGGAFDHSVLTVASPLEGKTITQKSYHFKKYNTPYELFDICYVKHNASSNDKDTPFKGGKDEIGVLCGCVINQLTLKYESASSDASVKCTIEGFALCPYVQFKNIPAETAFMDNVDVSNEVLVGGCVLALGGSDYNPIAQTDSAEVVINNNITRRGNCLKLTASSYTLGPLDITVNTSTYSNDPAKYLYALYGKGDAGDVAVQTVSKKLNKVKDLRIISTDSTSISDQKKDVFNGMEIVLKDVFIGNYNYDWSLDNAIMDTPDLRATDVGIIITSQDATPAKTMQAEAPPAKK